MGKGSGQTKGYRYYMSLLSGLCRGPVDEVVEIDVGGESAWNGHACSIDEMEYINAPELFGGDDKEGGIQGPFAIFPGAKDQVLPGNRNYNPLHNKAPGGVLGTVINGLIGGALGVLLSSNGKPVRANTNLPDVRESIGGLVSQFRGVTTIWFDGMVSAMNPYLKEWKFRVRRSQRGWFGKTWYPSKATIWIGGNALFIATNRANDLAVSADGTSIKFNRNAQTGDELTINGQKLTFIEGGKDVTPGQYEVVPNSNRERTVRNVANIVNSMVGAYKATATYTNDTVTFAPDRALTTIAAMNAAHIVYECWTNPEWGRGLATGEIDEPSFIATANQLCAEGFGLCLAWYRKEEIKAFVKKVCDLVGAANYVDRETGKVVMRLIRGDYNVADLPLFTPETGLIAINEDDTNSADDSYNEIIGTAVDPITNMEFQRRAQNLAAYASQGAPSSLDQDYRGIPTKALLDRVLLRDLRAMASGLKKYTITLDRRAWRVAPGSVIRITHPGRGIANLVLRVGEIDDGNLVNGAIKLKCAVDVFGLPSTSYVGVTSNGWTPPSRVAAPAVDERLMELGYRDLYRLVGQAEADKADPTSAYVGTVAVQPNTTSLEYDLATKADGEDKYTVDTRGSFTGNAVLYAAIAPLDTAAVFKRASMFDADNVGEVLLIGDELVRLDAYDDATGAATLTRGVADTIPAAHAAGALAWTVDDDIAADPRLYATGETVLAKVLTRTSAMTLDPAQADEMEIDLVGRHARPYPPADVRVGGVSIYAKRSEQPVPVIAWAERNRITLADSIVGHTEATVAAEPDTTYTIRVYDVKTGTLLRTTDSITDGSWTYTADMQTADQPGTKIRVELEASRDGLTSWQHYDFTIVLKAGWGYGWGMNWGSPA